MLFNNKMTSKYPLAHNINIQVLHINLCIVFKNNLTSMHPLSPNINVQILHTDLHMFHLLLHFQFTP